MTHRDTPETIEPQLQRGSVGKRVLGPGTLPPETTPLILRLLREERDRIERKMDQFNATRSHPGYQPMQWFDYESHLASERLRLAECNAAVAALSPVKEVAETQMAEHQTARWSIFDPDTHWSVRAVKCLMIMLAIAAVATRVWP